MTVKERRECIRGRIPFKVSFRIVDPEETDRLTSAGAEKNSHLRACLSPDRGASLDLQHNAVDRTLIGFLLKLDEKLDLIVQTLAREKMLDNPYHTAVGADISGTGMKIFTDLPIKPGQLIHADFSLCKDFFLYVDVYGRVVRTAGAPDGKPGLYEAGVQFLNLSPGEREKIIAIVFKINRETIREMRQGE